MQIIKKTLYLVILCLSLLFWGCVVRTYTVEKPRVDQEVSGNQGYLYGTPRQEEKETKKLSSKRKIRVVEIELGQSSTTKLKPRSSQEEIDESEIEDIILEEPEGYPEQIDEELLADEYKIYTVKKGDTLQKISFKFYNTTKRWKKIYEANEDILKIPDKVYPGQVLRIPLQ